MWVKVLAERGSDSLPSPDARWPFFCRVLSPFGNVIHFDAVLDRLSMQGDDKFSVWAGGFGDDLALAELGHS
jgi:hypothetical protein